MGIAAMAVISTRQTSAERLYAGVSPPPSLEQAPQIIRELHAGWMAWDRTPRTGKSLAFIPGIYDLKQERDLDTCIRFVQAWHRYPDSRPRSYDEEFMALLPQQLAGRLLDDEDRLVAYLATVPCDRILHSYPEETLVYPDSGGVVIERLSILFDAFERSRDADAQRSLHTAIWRTFGDQAGPSNLPAHTYVQNCKTWFRDNCARLEINPRATNPTEGSLEGSVPGARLWRSDVFLVRLRGE